MNLGNAFSFLAAPAIVPDPTASNETEAFINDFTFPGFAKNESNGCPILKPSEKLHIENRLRILMYLGNCFLSFL